MARGAGNPHATLFFLPRAPQNEFVQEGRPVRAEGREAVCIDSTFLKETKQGERWLLGRDSYDLRTAGFSGPRLGQVPGLARAWARWGRNQG